MIPNINPKKMDKMLKKMGVKQEEIDAEEVIIKGKNKTLIVRNPTVMKVNMMGQESLQITGEIEEEKESFNEEDIKTIMEQTNSSEEEAKNALEEEKDIAAAILKLSNS